MPVGLADAYASLRLEIGSAYTLIFFFMIVPLLLAMQAADPSVTPDAVEAIPGVTIPELRAAIKVVLALIGVDLVDAPAGAPRPGEPPASTGPTSTAP